MSWFKQYVYLESNYLVRITLSDISRDGWNKNHLNFKINHSSIWLSFNRLMIKKSLCVFEKSMLLN